MREVVVQGEFKPSSEYRTVGRSNEGIARVVRQPSGEH